MVFVPPKRLPTLQDLKQTLANSKTQTSDKSLYQTIFQLIDRISVSRDIIVGDTTIVDNSLNDINTIINNIITNNIGPGGGGGSSTASFLTANNELATLPNSLRLVAGLNITFVDGGGIRTINATGGGISSDYVVMSDGAAPIPEPVDDGFGDFIYVSYTP